MKNTVLAEVVVFSYDEYIDVKFRDTCIEEYKVKIAGGVSLPKWVQMRRSICEMSYETGVSS
jgi:hypothetical protein